MLFVLFILILNLVNTSCNPKIENCIKKSDYCALKKVLENRASHKTKLNIDVFNMQGYLALADQIVQASNDNANTVNNVSVKKRIFLGVSLIGISIYQLITKILDHSNACNDNVAVQANSLTADTLTMFGMGAFGVFQLYLGFSNQDAKDKLANAVALKQALEELQKTSTVNATNTQIIATV